MAALSNWLLATKTKDGLKSWTEPSREAAFEVRDRLKALAPGGEEIFIFRLSLVNGRLYVERKSGKDERYDRQHPIRSAGSSSTARAEGAPIIEDAASKGLGTIGDLLSSAGSRTGTTGL